MTAKATGPNYLGTLAIARSYILSAQLVEMQGGGGIMRYTNSRAESLDENSSESVHLIDVGEVD